MTQALFVGRLQEPWTEVAVNLDARSEDSLGQIPQPSRLPVHLCHICIHTPISTRSQPQLREATLPGAPPRRHPGSGRSYASALFLWSPMSRLPASPPPCEPSLPLFLSSAQHRLELPSRSTRFGCPTRERLRLPHLEVLHIERSLCPTVSEPARPVQLQDLTEHHCNEECVRTVLAWTRAERLWIVHSAEPPLRPVGAPGPVSRPADLGSFLSRAQARLARLRGRAPRDRVRVPLLQ